MLTDTGVVKSRFTNIYKYPVVSANIVARVVRGTKITLLDEQDGFFKVAYMHQIAYVPRECLAATEKE